MNDMSVLASSFSEVSLGMDMVEVEVQAKTAKEARVRPINITSSGYLQLETRGSSVHDHQL